MAAELRLYRHRGYDGVEREIVVVYEGVPDPTFEEDFADATLVESIELHTDVGSWPTNRPLTEDK